MAFDVMAQYGEPITTRKNNSNVVVQLVSITASNRPDAEGSMVADVRETYVDNTTGQLKSSKNGFMFSKRSQVEDLMDALQTILDDEDWIEAEEREGPSEPAAPVKTVKRRKRSAALATPGRKKK